MAFPTVASLDQTIFATASTSHDVDMPATVVAGDLLLVLITITGTSAITTPSGWTSLFNDDDGLARYAGYYKSADGDEDGTTVDFVSGSSAIGVSQTYRIDAGTWGELEAATSLTTFTSNPNPPGLNPTGWDVEDTLWIASFGSRENGPADEPTVTGFPVNYTGGTSTFTGLGSESNDVLMASARRNRATASEDPTAFTTSTQVVGVVEVTVGISPELGISVDLTRATETETARAISITKGVNLGRVTETEQARLLGITKDFSLGRVTEAEAARAIQAVQAIVVNIGRVTESEVARLFPRLIGRVIEVESARLFPRILGRVVEVEVANSIGAIVVYIQPVRMPGGRAERTTLPGGSVSGIILHGGRIRWQ